MKFWHLLRQIGFILQFYLITFVSQLPSERERLLSAEVCQSVSKEKQEKNRTRLELEENKIKEENCAGT
jgi:hypothetical protein